MKVTGYKLQHAIREASHTRDIAATQFSEGLWVFEDEGKIKPEEAMMLYRKAEDQIALLQEAQGRYNLAVQVKVMGQGMTLSEAVKRVGGAGRMEKMWRTATKSSGGDRYYRSEMVREAGSIHAQRTVGVGRALEFAREAAKYASALREAIQVANATEVEIELDSALFE